MWSNPAYGVHSRAGLSLISCIRGWLGRISRICLRATRAIVLLAGVLHTASELNAAAVETIKDIRAGFRVGIQIKNPAYFSVSVENLSGSAKALPASLCAIYLLDARVSGWARFSAIPIAIKVTDSHGKVISTTPGSKDGWYTSGTLSSMIVEDRLIPVITMKPAQRLVQTFAFGELLYDLETLSRDVPSDVPLKEEELEKHSPRLRENKLSEYKLKIRIVVDQRETVETDWLDGAGLSVLVRQRADDTFHE